MIRTRGICLRGFLVAGALLLASGTDARAGFIPLTAVLNGAQELSPNSSLGTGNAGLILDDVNRILLSAVTYQNLTGNTTSADIEDKSGVVIHVFSTAPTGLTSGSISDTWIGLTATNIAALEAGNYYVNIHTTAFPDGEIRGQATVPEPSSLALAAMGTALLGGGWLLRRRHRA